MRLKINQTCKWLLTWKMVSPSEPISLRIPFGVASAFNHQTSIDSVTSSELKNPIYDHYCCSLSAPPRQFTDSTNRLWRSWVHLIRVLFEATEVVLWEGFAGCLLSWNLELGSICRVHWMEKKSGYQKAVYRNKTDKKNQWRTHSLILIFPKNSVGLRIFNVRLDEQDVTNLWISIWGSSRILIFTAGKVLSILWLRTCWIKFRRWVWWGYWINRIGITFWKPHVEFSCIKGRSCWTPEMASNGGRSTPQVDYLLGGASLWGRQLIRLETKSHLPWLPGKNTFPRITVEWSSVLILNYINLLSIHYDNQPAMQGKKKQNFSLDWLLLKQTEPSYESINGEEGKQFTMNMDSHRGWGSLLSAMEKSF